MALRGETVGTAFVRILAEGSGLDRSIKDEMRQREGVFEQAGAQDSKAYRKGFDDELKKTNFVKDLERLARGSGRFDAIGKFIGGEVGDGFLDRLDEQFRKRFGPEIGDRLGRELREALVNQQDLDVVKRFTDNIGQHVIKVTRDIQREESDAARKIESDFERSFRAIIAETDRMSAEADRSAERYRTSFIRAGDDIEKSFSRTAQQFEADVDRIGRDNDRLRRGFSKTGRDISGISIVVGKAFGKGSRNNFVNFIGTVVGGFSNLIEKIPGLRSLLGPLTSDFDKMSKTGQGFFQTLFEGGFASGVTKLAGSFVGLGIAFAGFVTLLGPIISLFAGIAGGILAMASSMVFAAAAGIPVLIGGLGALVGFVGVGVAAFASLSKAQKSALGQDLKPLVDSFKELGQTIAGPVFKSLKDIVGIAQEAVEAFEPFAKPFGRAFADSLRIIAGIAQTPAFAEFVQAFGEFLPGAMRDLARIVRNVATLLFGLFRASIPVASDFLGWLSRITGHLSRMVNSVKGQRDLKRFFSDAADSAKVVADLIGDIAHAVGLLLAGGKDTGDSLLGDLDTKVEEFVAFLEAHPDTLRKWFERAGEITSDIGKIVLGITEIIDTLDSAQGSQAAQFILTLADDFLTLLNTAIRLSDGFVLLSLPLGVIVGGLKLLVNLGGKIGDFFGNFFGQLGRGFAPGRFAGLIQPGAILKAILGRLPDIDIKDIFKVGGLAAKILGALPNPVDFVSHMAFDIARIVQGLGSIVHDIVSRFPNPVDLVSHMAFDIIRAVDGLGSLAGNILRSFPSVSDILNRFPTASDIVNWIGDIVLNVDVNFPDPPSWLQQGLTGGLLSHLTASGGVFFGPQARVIGEAGPEAVVPLDRPLSQVDPAVRLLSAIAQGKWPGASSVGRSIDVGGITVVTPTEDPAAVATEVLNQLAATSYL